MANHQRVDVALVEQGLFESRAKAQEAIEAGLVTVDGAPVDKTSRRIAAGTKLVALAPYPYVSRGGLKLAAALERFEWTAKGQICLDIGASTGGFCDVLLRAGAAQVHAVDVGHGQIHPRIGFDPRVVVREGLDARELSAKMFEARPTLVVCDVSFISLKLVLPPVVAIAAAGARLIALIKPQFETERRFLKRGIVRNTEQHQAICTDIAAFVHTLGWRVVGIIDSPIRGGDGNCEFLLGAARG